jgi:DNA-binding CsgD family transcriptional regulator/tetratricopeptide (TPR) repeat protein
LLFIRSDFPAMRRYGEEALSIWRESGVDGRSGLAFTLFRLGDLALEEGDYALAPMLLQEALDVYRELNDRRGISGTLMLFGWAAMRTGDYTQAAVHLEECRALAQQTGDTRNTAFALSGLGEMAVRQGQYERAAALLTESLRLNRAGGYHWSVATVLGSLGWVALAQRQYAAMAAFLGESLALRMKIGDQGGIAWCLEKLAEAALVQGQTSPAQTQFARYQAAARIFGAAAHLRAPVKSIMDPVDQPAYDRNLASLRRDLGEEAFAAAWVEGAALALPAMVDYALEEPALEAAPESTPDAVAGRLQGTRSPESHEGGQRGGLTARELEVVDLIVQGKSNREIAAAMTIGVKTVETYITRILNKLGFESRVQVATWALEQGFGGLPQSSKS